MYGVKMKTLTEEHLRDVAANADLLALIDALSGASVNGRPIATRRVCIGPGLLDRAGDLAAEVLGSASGCAVVMDAASKAAAGSRVLEQLDDPLEILLTPIEPWDHLTPHDSFIEAVMATAKSCRALIAVGSGTINDFVKYAATQLGVPCLVVATAPSMNGYTSNIAALLVRGLKVTLPCEQPAAVLADTEVLARAPAEMIRSGYADLMSKPVSAADWRLASLVVGERFTQHPGIVMNAAIRRCVEQAEAIGRAEPDAVGVLMQSLILSGYGMTIAGTSAPASGGEHLISHYLDMAAYAERRHPAPHGLQVALGTLMTSRLYELLRNAEPGGFRVKLETLQEKADTHGRLWPAVEREAAKQVMDPAAAETRIGRITGHWSEIWRQLDAILDSHEEIRSRLSRAGVSLSPSACGISVDKLSFALRHAADMRARYTVLHFARDLGLLETFADEIIKIFE